MSTSSEYRKPLPHVRAVDEAYWAAAARSELAMQQCDECGKVRFPPSRFCPSCLSDQGRWRTLSGRGWIRTFCRFHKLYIPGFEDEIPYYVILVQLEEGPLVYSNLVDSPAAAPQIGMPVVATFEAVKSGMALVKFRAADQARVRSP
jgi:uncharacterized protein